MLLLLLLVIRNSNSVETAKINRKQIKLKGLCMALKRRTVPISFKTGDKTIFLEFLEKYIIYQTRIKKKY